MQTCCSAPADGDEWCGGRGSWVEGVARPLHPGAAPPLGGLRTRHRKPQGRNTLQGKSAVLWQKKQNKKFANYCKGKFPGSSLRCCDFYPKDKTVAFAMKYLVFSKAFSDIAFRKILANFVSRKFCAQLDGNTEFAHLLPTFCAFVVAGNRLE